MGASLFNLSLDMNSDPTIAILEVYMGAYGRLSAAGQNRLIRLLELIQRMTPDQLTFALAEIREIEPTV